MPDIMKVNMDFHIFTIFGDNHERRVSPEPGGAQGPPAGGNNGCMAVVSGDRPQAAAAKLAAWAG